MTCTAVHLASPSLTINMDGTADADGVYWLWRTIAGWWEGGTPAMAFDGKPGMDGSIAGSGLRRGRPVTLGGVAYVPPTIAEATAKTLLQGARHKVMRAADLVRASGVFTVDEDDTSRFVVVWRNLAPTFEPQKSAWALDFTVPLVAPAWQKQSTTLHASSVAASVSAANGGDADTLPLVSIFGPTNANPNVTLGGVRQVRTTLAGLGGGDTAVIDFATMTMLLNGLDVTGNLDVTSDFFALAPGSNTVALGNAGASGTLRVDWHDGWL